MNAIIKTNGDFGQLPEVFVNTPIDDDLGGGIRGGFSVLGIRGKTWRIKRSGEETDLLQPNGDPIFSIEVVIVKAAPNLSKIYYANGYQEGSTDRPDCYSISGVAPDPSSPNLQSKVCATCPQNVIGSRVNNVTGKPSRACADTKRLVIVPADDLLNEYYGGPMLLRIPAASLKEVLNYSHELKKRGFPYAAVVTRLRFDTALAYPKVMFNAVRALSPEEAQTVMELRESPQTESILSNPAEMQDESVSIPPTSDGFFEQPPAPQGTPRTAAAPKPVSTPQPAPKPAQAPPKPAQEVPHDPVTGEAIEEAKFEEAPTQEKVVKPAFGAAVPGQTQTTAKPAAPPKSAAFAKASAAPAKEAPKSATKEENQQAQPPAEDSQDAGIPENFTDMLDDMLNS